VIFIDPSQYDFEKIEELVYETAAEDIEQATEYIKIICGLDDYHDIEKFLEGKDIELLESKIDFIPDNELEVTDFDQALKFTKLVEAFDADEDVSLVSSNEIISPELQAQVREFIEKNTFRT
jgi:transcriptional/translational regulatory protein YebC/TACO1